MIDLKEITFYNINPDYNTLGAESYQAERRVLSSSSRYRLFIDFYGEGLKPITAYFAPTGTACGGTAKKLHPFLLVRASKSK